MQFDVEKRGSRMQRTARHLAIFAIIYENTGAFEMEEKEEALVTEHKLED